MNDKVVEFKRKESAEPDVPHLAGKAQCKVCHYLFMAIMETGRVAMPCPKCNNDAHLLGEVVTDSDQWACHCGYQLFRIDRDGPYCTRCGLPAKGWFE